MAALHPGPTRRKITIYDWSTSSDSREVDRVDTPLRTLTNLVRIQWKRRGDAVWALRGMTSNARYTQRNEQQVLAAKQAELGRQEATCAALIPVTKSEAWWRLAQDERREIFEDSSHHIAIGLTYLPAVARRLYRSSDLGEPFDFLTWFEYAPNAALAFEELVSQLRTTTEWNYVEREVDIRLTR